ncbi:Uncharacterised protein g6235 [Pycnogonum litorale]
MSSTGGISILFHIVFSLISLWTIVQAKCPDKKDILPCTCTSNGDDASVNCFNEGTSSEISHAVTKVIGGGAAISSLKIIQVNMEEVPERLTMGSYAEQIIIIQCNISSVHETAFRTLGDHLKKLDLSRNNLKFVPTSAINHLKNLRTLHLAFNRIEVVREGDLNGLRSLTSISLFSNKIKNIATFENPNLNTVNLGNNMLTSIPSTAVENLAKLTDLLLDGNRISMLNRNELEGVGATLDRLDLSENSITTLPNKCFENLSELESLNLDNNRISIVQDQAFAGLQDTLKYLKLASNRMKQIPSKALKELKKLIHLHLPHNQIQKIDADSLDGYGTNVRYLYLDSNKLSEIHVKSFQILDNIKWLKLQRNQLTVLELDSFAPILDTLEKLEIYGNPYNCDCKMKWFATLLSGHVKCNNKSQTITDTTEDNDPYLPDCGDEWVKRLINSTIPIQSRNIVKERPNMTKCKKPRAFLGIPLLSVPTERMVCESSSMSGLVYKPLLCLTIILQSIIIKFHF